MTQAPPSVPGFFGQNLSCLRGERVVFARLDFSLEAGEALVLLGPNGSGKSTLLRLMAGLLRPAGGLLAWNGVAVREDPEAHAARLHYVGHHDPVKAVLTVAENIALWAALHGAPDAGDNARTAMERLEVAHLAEVPGRFLSAGQKRRVNLARLAASTAPLWLLDEPSVALDREALARLEGLIAEHRARGGMVALSTHAAIALDRARELHLDRFAPCFEEMP